MNFRDILYIKDKVINQLLVSYKGATCFLNTIGPKICVILRKKTDKFYEDVLPFIEQGEVDLLEILKPVNLPTESDFDAYKNGCVEIYLSLAVMLIALSSGELLGNTLFGNILSFIFTPSVEVFVMIATPLSFFLRSYEDACYDEVERKKELFISSLITGTFIGHLFGKELDNDKKKFKKNMSTSGLNTIQVLFSGALTFLLMAALSIITIKGSFILFLLIIMTYFHKEFLGRHVTTKLVSIGTNQFIYVATFALIQVIFAIF